MDCTPIVTVGDTVDAIILLIVALVIFGIGIFFFLTFDKLKLWNWAIAGVLSLCMMIFIYLLKLAIVSLL